MLTKEQQERIAILNEECGEVVQVVGKILRHGIDSTNPETGETNVELLEKEIGDVEIAIELMKRNLDISTAMINEHKHKKCIKMTRYLHHNIVRGLF